MEREEDPPGGPGGGADRTCPVEECQGRRGDPPRRASIGTARGRALGDPPDPRGPRRHPPWRT
eukprot:scaffold285_cov330-Pavlova_lutheri.AAC.121